MHFLFWRATCYALEFWQMPTVSPFSSDDTFCGILAKIFGFWAKKFRPILEYPRAKISPHFAEVLLKQNSRFLFFRKNVAKIGAFWAKNVSRFYPSEIPALLCNFILVLFWGNSCAVILLQYLLKFRGKCIWYKMGPIYHWNFGILGVFRGILILLLKMFFYFGRIKRSPKFWFPIFLLKWNLIFLKC